MAMHPLQQQRRVTFKLATATGKYEDAHSQVHFYTEIGIAFSLWFHYRYCNRDPLIKLDRFPKWKVQEQMRHQDDLGSK